MARYNRTIRHTRAGTILPPIPVADVTISRGAASVISKWINGLSQSSSELRGGSGDSGWTGQNAAAVNAAKALAQGAFGYFVQYLTGFGPTGPWPDPAVACPVWNAGEGGGPAVDHRWDSWDGFVANVAAIATANGGKVIFDPALCPWHMGGQRVLSQLVPGSATVMTDVKLVPDLAHEFSTAALTAPVTRSDAFALAMNGGSPITFPVDYVTPSSSTRRVIDSQLTNWATLVYHACKRAMSKHGVRYFIIWPELQGYFHPAGDGTTNAKNVDKANTWDAGTSAGNASGVHATHGYTYMYNQVAAQIRTAATELGVTVFIGGGYAVQNFYDGTVPGGFQTADSFLAGNKSYGHIDDRPVEAMKSWLALKTTADFIVVRSSVKCKDIVTDINGLAVAAGTARATATHDVYAMQDAYADFVAWLRQLNPATYPGCDTLPVIQDQYFTMTNPLTTDARFFASIQAVGIAKFIAAGGTSMIRWSGKASEDGMALWSPTTQAGGGVATPLYDVLKAITDDFGATTQLYTPTISDPTKLHALVSGMKMLLINKSGAGLIVDVGTGTNINLAPSETRVVTA